MKKKDKLRLSRNQTLTARLKQPSLDRPGATSDGIKDCYIAQIGADTDDGFAMLLEFDPARMTQDGALSAIHDALHQVLPDAPVWGDVREQKAGSLVWLFSYLDDNAKLGAAGQKG